MERILLLRKRRPLLKKAEAVAERVNVTGRKIIIDITTAPPLSLTIIDTGTKTPRRSQRKTLREIRTLRRIKSVTKRTQRGTSIIREDALRAQALLIRRTSEERKYLESRRRIRLLQPMSFRMLQQRPKMARSSD